MFNPRPPHRPPEDASPALRKWAKEIQESLEASSRYVGNNSAGQGFEGGGLAGGGLAGEVPHERIFICGQIIDASSDFTGSGSGSGSGSGNGFNVTFDPNGPGFFDKDGFLVYAFEEIYADDAWKGTIVPGGIKTQIEELQNYSIIPGSNYAYPMNGEELEIGTNVLLKRARNHWLIIGGESGPGAGSGSGGTVNGFIFKCNDDGTGGTITPHRLLGGGGGPVV